MQPQRCSTFAARAKALNVLMVGSERRDEFQDAMRLCGLGHSVIVVNPREGASARRFANAGGTFIRKTIERLPLALGPFDLICESYPYTVARVECFCEEVPCPVWSSTLAMRAYAMPRLRRLAPGGRWIVFTESPGFACALRSIVPRDSIIQQNFSVRIVPLTNAEAPQSLYPRLSTRFKVICRRHPAESHRNSSVPARKAYS